MMKGIIDKEEKTKDCIVAVLIEEVYVQKVCRSR